MIRSTSPAQFACSTDGTIPSLESVRDDVWALGMPMPGGHLPYSLVYLLRDDAGGMHIIDPGWDSDDNWRILKQALTGIGTSVHDVRSITATHLHPDHIGMARRLREATQATLQMHHAEADALAGSSWSPSVVLDQLDDWGVPQERRGELEGMTRGRPAIPKLSIDQTLDDDERLEISGFDLVVMHTPGHTPGHVTIRDQPRSLIFTGDHVLPTMHAGLGLGGATRSNALVDYLAALGRVSAFTDHEVLPGHGYRFSGLAERSNASAEHHLRRSREVAAVLARSPQSSTWEVASQLTWTAGWKNLDGFYVYSALSQTNMHREFVRGGGLDTGPTVA